jgi:hypothetical protein
MFAALFVAVFGGCPASTDPPDRPGTPTPVTPPAASGTVVPVLCALKQPTLSALGDHRLIDTDQFLSALNSALGRGLSSPATRESTGCDDDVDVASWSTLEGWAKQWEHADAVGPLDDLASGVQQVPVVSAAQAKGGGGAGSGTLSPGAQSEFTDWASSINLEPAAPYFGAGQGVIVMDAGRPPDHPLLPTGATYWTNAAGIQVAGCFVAEGCAIAAGGMESKCFRGQADPTVSAECEACDARHPASCEHASAVVGVITAGDSHSSVAPRGVAPDAAIVPIRVMQLGPHGRPVASWTDVRVALKKLVAAHGTPDLDAVRILYMGFASTDPASTELCGAAGAPVPTTPARGLVDRAIAAGFVIVAPAGNAAGGVGFPACVPGAIGVMATENGAPASFSNSDSSGKLDLGAPGSGLLFPYEYDVSDGNGGTKHALIAWGDGTTLAAATVAGGLALASEKSGTTFATMDAAQLTLMLSATTTSPTPVGVFTLSKVW